MKIEFQKHFCGFRWEAERSENTELHNNWGNVIKIFLTYTSCRLMEKFGQGKDFSDRRKQIQMVLRS